MLSLRDIRVFAVVCGRLRAAHPRSLPGVSVYSCTRPDTVAVFSRMNDGAVSWVEDRIDRARASASPSGKYGLGHGNAEMLCGWYCFCFAEQTRSVVAARQQSLLEV